MISLPIRNMLLLGIKISFRENNIEKRMLKKVLREGSENGF